MGVIARERAKAIDVMLDAIGGRSKVRDAVGDMFDALLRVGCGCARRRLSGGRRGS
jgi:hypothetical protein